ncbi:hypothetical protein CVT24_010488 [Panaeolus cyanescens]|uniref:Uncharacterized protein n=1 Tax=Panaeolus cyanescens TaxID=181874 RepID=A0A409YLX8_9AGAR|nr:hypothetical protein CVT24_010488 [Panaeolus cyanescens]
MQLKLTTGTIISSLTLLVSMSSIVGAIALPEAEAESAKFELQVNLKRVVEKSQEVAYSNESTSASQANTTLKPSRPLGSGTFENRRWNT